MSKRGWGGATIRRAARKMSVIPASALIAPETSAHIAIWQYLCLALPDDAVAFHVPNEGKRSAAEAGRMADMGLVAGAPDFVILHQRHGFTLEVKRAETGRESAPQVAFRGRLARAIIPHGIVENIDDAEHFLLTWGIPLRVVKR